MFFLFDAIKKIRQRSSMLEIAFKIFMEIYFMKTDFIFFSLVNVRKCTQSSN